MCPTSLARSGSSRPVSQKFRNLLTEPDK